MGAGHKPAQTGKDKPFAMSCQSSWSSISPLPGSCLRESDGVRVGQYGLKSWVMQGTAKRHVVSTDRSRVSRRNPLPHLLLCAISLSFAPMSKRKSHRRSRPRYPQRLRERVRVLQERLRALEIDALLVTNSKDIRYLTGFVGEDSWTLIRSRSAKPHILSDFRFDAHIDLEAPHAVKILRKKSLSEELEKLAGRMKLQRIGVQPEHVSLQLQKALNKALGRGVIKPIDDGLLMQRSIKSPKELKAIRGAIAIQQQAMTRTLKEIKPGMTENQIAAHLEYQMRSLGAEGRSFNTIVAADANAAMCHAIPGSTKVRKGGLLLMDWGALYQGYCSDMTRTYGIGAMPRKMREIYKIVLEAQLAAIDHIKPGVPLADVNQVARRIIKKAGYDKQFGHGLGHGIGLDVHEQPSMGQLSKGELQPGQVVTVEPGIYLPGVGGVRIEDDVLVTRRGYEVLCDLPKSLDSAIID